MGGVWEVKQIVTYFGITTNEVYQIFSFFIFLGGWGGGVWDVSFIVM